MMMMTLFGFNVHCLLQGTRGKRGQVGLPGSAGPRVKITISFNAPSELKGNVLMKGLMRMCFTDMNKVETHSPTIHVKTDLWVIKSL